MSDQRLLERAALAAGIGPVLCYERARNCLRIGNRRNYSLWRPLDDDKDALRLAAHLQLDVEWFTNLQFVCVSRRGFGENIGWLDDAARPGALRRAIVLVADQIGSTLP